MLQLISPEMILGSTSCFIFSLPKSEINTPPKIGLIMNSWPTVEPPPVAASVSTISESSNVHKAVLRALEKALEKAPEFEISCRKLKALLGAHLMNKQKPWRRLCI